MIINIYHQVPYDVYIGRAGKGQSGYFGNPIQKNKICPECSDIHKTGGETLICYEKYARRRIANDSKFKDAIKALKGKILGCFCRPKNGFGEQLLCHGQVIEKLSEELNQTKE